MSTRPDAWRLRPDQPRRGFALVSVLWAVAVVSMIAASLLSSLAQVQKAKRVQAKQLQAELIAEAAINRAVLALSERILARRWRVDGSQTTFVFAGVEVRTRIFDESGKIDLNAAGHPLLSAAFRAVGLDIAAATQFADRILAWRSPEGVDLTTGNDAAAGYRLRHGPFQTLDELHLIAGITPELFGKVAPLLTVYSGRPSIDPIVARPAALSALAESDGERAREIDAALALHLAQRDDDDAGKLDIAVPLGGRTFLIQTEVSDTHIVREAVIRFSDNPGRPYWVMQWRRVYSESFAGSK